MKLTEKNVKAGMPIAAIGIALGLAVVIWTSRKVGYSWDYFAAYWLPQAAVLGVALLFRASWNALGGIAMAMAVYLYLLDVWGTDPLIWLVYLFSFPGVLIGVLVTLVFPSRKPFEAVIAFAWVALGIVLNLSIFIP
ncbi:hypothetical protein ACQKQA_15875 [Pseudomonas sp. NPDC089530]|uniref:hypothetical protein n=1 Tax=Pseudomonas sp. NPDC089530 TaxID=3390651 RepID=UPI003D05350F